MVSVESDCGNQPTPLYDAIPERPPLLMLEPDVSANVKVVADTVLRAMLSKIPDR